MQEEYHHIGTVFFEHKYFENNLFNSSHISLTEETEQVIRNLNIVLKPFAGGFHILASNAELFETYGDSVKLIICLDSNDSLFYNYTELPAFDVRNKLFYFNNINANTIDNDYRLNKTDFVSETDLIDLCYSQVDLSSFNDVSTYTVTDFLSSEVYLQEQTQSTAKKHLNANNLPEGILKVSNNGGEEKLFYHVAKSIWKKPIAVCEIYLGTLFTAYKNKGKVNYRIRFNNRETIWTYFLVDPVFRKFEKLTIINKDKEEVFSALQKQTLFNNHEALVFTSKSKVPVTRQNIPVFQLIDNFDPELKTGNIILKNLPAASAEQIFYDTSKSDNDIYSHIYI